MSGFGESIYRRNGGFVSSDCGSSDLRSIACWTPKFGGLRVGRYKICTSHVTILSVLCLE